jgi:hypothetical protein
LSIERDQAFSFSFLSSFKQRLRFLFINQTLGKKRLLYGSFSLKIIKLYSYMASNIGDTVQLTTDLPSSSSERIEPLSFFQGYEKQPLVSLEQALQQLISIVPGIEQMLDRVKQNDHQSKNHLSSDESASIMLYTLKWETIQSSFRFILNETLRSQIHQNLLPWFPYLRLFINTLSKLPSISFHTVYCGLKQDLRREYLKGESFIWWEFISCKSSIELVEQSMDANEARTIFIIECHSAKDISQYSNDENEIIIYPARQFEVISSLNCGNQLNLIQLREIQRRHLVIDIPQTTSNNIHPVHNLEFMIDQSLNHSKVDLIKQQLTDTDMNIVVKHAIINKQCKSLLLANNKITSIGSLIIAEALNNNTTLELLSLSYNNLSDEGIQSLTNILSLNNSNLKILSLHSTGITDESVKHLSKMLKTNTNLTWLHLGGNQISDQGVHLLADVLIRYNKTLKILALSENELITDSSVDSLVEIFKQNNSLETLWINDCNLSPDGKKKLKQIFQSNIRLFALVVDSPKFGRKKKMPKK